MLCTSIFLRNLVIVATIFLFISSINHAQVLESDSLALVEIYESTSGPDWTDNAQWLTGTVNSWKGVAVENGRVTVLDLDNNNLTGALPPAVFELTAIKVLKLSDNHLTGEIPDVIGNLVELEHLHLEENQLSGSLPAGIESCISLRSLYLNSNNFTGTFPPTLSNITSLENLYARSNSFSGSFPSVLLDMPGITILILSDNDFEGVIPEEIKNLENLVLLALDRNKFSGPIPDLSSLTKLNTLHLSYNELEGEMTGFLGYHPNLYYLTLSDNNLSGYINASHFSADFLTFVNLENNSFSGMDNFTMLANEGVLQRLHVDRNSISLDDLAPNASLKAINFSYHTQQYPWDTEEVHIEPGNDYTLLAGMSNPEIEYQWRMNGLPIPGANSAEFTIQDFGPEDVGDYSFIASLESLPEVVIMSPPRPLSLTTGVVETALSAGIRIGPVPASDILFIDLPEWMGTARITAHDFKGQEIASLALRGSGELSTRHWPGGIYLLRLQAAGKIFTQKIVVQ